MYCPDISAPWVQKGHKLLREMTHYYKSTSCYKIRRMCVPLTHMKSSKSCEMMCRQYKVEGIFMIMYISTFGHFFLKLLAIDLITFKV